MKPFSFFLLTLLGTPGLAQVPTAAPPQRVMAPVEASPVPTDTVKPQPAPVIRTPVVPGNPTAASRKVPVWVSKKGPYRPERTRRTDLLHTRLEVRPVWGNQELHGSATLTLQPVFYPQSTVELDAKGLKIASVVRLDTLTAEPGLVEALRSRQRPERDSLGHLVADSSRRLLAPARPLTRVDTILTADQRPLRTDTLTFRHDEKVLTINLGRTYRRGEPYHLRIAYVARPGDLPKGGSEAITDNRGLYFINPTEADSTKPRQLWTQGETEANSAWFPTIDAPNEKMTQEVLITVEKKLRTLSNGTLVRSVDADSLHRTDHWRQAYPHAPYLTMLAVGDFAVVEDSTVNGVPIQYYVEPAYAPHAKAIFGRTPAMLRFFTERFGVPYVWEKYAQVAVRDFVSGAMENTSATVHGAAIQKTPRQLVDGDDDAVIAHELAHHWFGNLVTAESWANLALQEALATYAEQLWAEHREGRDAGEFVGFNQLNDYLAEAEQKQEPLIRYQYLNREDVFDAHSYQKGARVLHLLRRQVGDEAFFEALKQYLIDNQFGTVELSDLREAFEKTTGEDLNWFFTQWFLSPGHPEIKVEQSYEVGKLILNISQQQDTLYTPVFRLPVKLDVWVEGQRNRYDLVIDRPRQVLEFAIPKRPDLVLFDADRALPASIEHEKPLKDWAFQYLHAEALGARYEAITRLENKIGQDSVARAVMMRALTDPFWRIRQVAASNFTDYDGPQFVEIELALQKLVKADPRPAVRAEALIALSSFSDDDNIEIYKQALADTSELVASQALDAYLITKPDDAGAIAARFENSSNPEVIVAVGNYLAGLGQEARYDWFVSQLSQLDANGLYQFLPVFGKYLVKTGDGVKRRSIPTLEGLARRYPTPFVRMAAYQMLGLMTDIEGVKGIRRDIKASEKDSKVAEMYKQMVEF
jgi:aminopeptidase N